MLNKKGSSNLSEQKQLLEPVLNILNNYNFTLNFIGKVL
ncbi:hypothetical protein GLO73106DRAFT_00009320 [Gloeocapsa sp. PCC 73106]|nr:hypothetical protein GLO73106DRAFT_00009320 [Gloeocapsa sp. PCC 73106]